MAWSIFSGSVPKTRASLFALAIFLIGIWSLAFYASVLLATVILSLLAAAATVWTLQQQLLPVEALRESDRKLSTILENVDACIYLKDTHGRFLFANRSLRDLFGAEAEEVVGQDDEKFFAPETVAQLREDERPVLEKGETIRTETTYRLKDGRALTYLVSKLPLHNNAGEVYAVCGISTDITERKQAEEKLWLAASVFTNAREGIMITAADGTIIDVNDAFSGITGYRRDEVLGGNPRALIAGGQKKEFYEVLWRDLVENGYWYGEVWNRRKNGEVYAVMQTISAVRDSQGNTRQYVALFSDITPLKEHEKKLERIAHYDALTGLPNRLLLADRLQQAMAQAQRRGQRLALVFLDLDGFKAINDHHGHEAGDQLLTAVATRMKETLREGDTLARLGGDEFVPVLPDIADVAAGVPLLTRLLAAAAEPVQADNAVLQVSASLGLTFYPQAQDVDAERLLSQADQAMYQAKLAGKNRYHVFDPEQDDATRSPRDMIEPRNLS